MNQESNIPFYQSRLSQSAMFRAPCSFLVLAWQSLLQSRCEDATGGKWISMQTLHTLRYGKRNFEFCSRICWFLHVDLFLFYALKAFYLHALQNSANKFPPAKRRRWCFRWLLLLLFLFLFLLLLFIVFLLILICQLVRVNCRLIDEYEYPSMNTRGILQSKP